MTSNRARPEQVGVASSPDFSPGFGILGQAGEVGWSIARRGIAVAMAQGGSAKMRRQIGPKTE